MTEPITFVVPGQADAAAVGRPAGAALCSAATRGGGAAPGIVKSSVQLGALRGAGSEPQRLSAVPGEDVVALHIAGGPVLLLHPATARDLMLAQNPPLTLRSDGGAAPDVVAVTPQLRWRGLEDGPVTRGLLGDVVLKAFEVVTGLLVDKAADIAASQVVRRVDEQVDADVYALNAQSLLPLKDSGLKVAGTVPASDRPMLVLVHGTFVDTVSTFGKLWTLHPQRVRTLFDHYGGRVYALDHPTLGASPIANALTLVQRLPDGAKLHLLTHSRGGLVAEVLARVCAAPLSAQDMALFADVPAQGDTEARDYAPQRAELRALAELARAKGIRVERVLRVACPARGTLLASQRLDAYLSVLKWTLELAGVPLLPGFVEFLTEVARRRADPRAIPGLAAMIPDTPLVNWLNSPPPLAGGAIAGDLRVVAGDLEGDSVGSWIKTLLTDAYYWTDNDIVVQTRSMYAGTPRAGGASFLLERSGKTTHFAYFANPRSVDAVVDGLTLAAPPGFQAIGPLSWAGKDAGGLRGLDKDPAKPAVFVLPGILGSNLRVFDQPDDKDGDRIWLGLRLIGGLDRLAYQPGGADKVEPDGPIRLVYGDLIEHLGETHEVIPFAFDWRRPIEEEAGRLADAVDAALDARKATHMPVRLLAHSMGGLLARTVQIVRPQTWQRLMGTPGARLLMLGTPNGGSWAPMQVLSGDDTFGNALAAFGSPLADRKARQIMAGMPGFLQLQAGLLDPALKLDLEGTWAKLARDDYEHTQRINWWHRSAGEAAAAAYRWGVPPQPVLDRAKQLREQLDEQLRSQLPGFADKLCLVIGQARATPVGFEQGTDGFVYLDAADGDGRVPRSSALLPGVDTWRLDCEHGSLPKAKAAFAAFAELLAEGKTTRLEPLAALRGQPVDGASLTRSRPSRQRASARPADTALAVFLREQGLDGEAVAPKTAALRVAVLNGNLSFVSLPLIVGHYRSSELTGSERPVDDLLGGAMSAALQAGLYPDAVRTHEVFVNVAREAGNPWRMPQPPSVVVVGLGDEGTLREAELQASVSLAVIAWSKRQAEEPARAGAAVEIAATLLGSGGLGISTSGAARSIARAVQQANVTLAQTGWPVVSRLVLVELYLDRASDAWQGLQVLAASDPAGFSIEPAIVAGTGPLRRQLDNGYRGADYDLISAVTRGDGGLEFALDTRRARTEVRAQRTQGALVRALVRDGARALGGDPGVGRTLFSLLVPPEVEPFLAGTERMVLDLDAGTAAIPWELLDAGAGADGSDRRPWAVRTQLLRRLRKSEFRERPHDATPEDSVLVIGEPKAPPAYERLPGARDEALAVCDALGGAGGIPAQRLLALVDQPEATQVIAALFSRRWRIVHIAGHGELPKAEGSDGERGGGVVLSDGLFLGPNEVRKMRTVPELVFVNCCHLAGFGSERALREFDPAGFAAGLADQLIEIGVRCVVAAGWPIEDGPAKEFCTAFYKQLVGGASFIQAVGMAREAAWSAGPSGRTWAAYQCYGDPNWVFRSGPGDAQAPRQEARDEFAAIASPVGLALALETLAVQSTYMGRGAKEQQGKLHQLEQRFGALWGSVGAVAEAFGIAWDAAGDRQAAIAWLDKAVQANDASASIKALQTLQNLRARQAWSDASSAGELQSALAGLQALVDAQATAERLNLLGSAHKRAALLARQAGRKDDERASLNAARAAYARAEARAAETGAADRFYPALNRIALELALHGGEAGWAGLDAAATTAARATLIDAVAQRPDFWSHVAQVELDVAEAVAGGALAARLNDLLAGFAAVHSRVRTAGMWESVATQAELVLQPYAERAVAAEAKAALALLKRLRRYAGNKEGRAA